MTGAGVSNIMVPHIIDSYSACPTITVSEFPFSRNPAAANRAGQGVHVPVHPAQEGGPTDGRPDQRCSSPDEVPEGLPAGRVSQLIF